MKEKSLVKSRIKSLNSDQFGLYNQMQSNDKLQICIPTGAGKGYLMMVDLLNQIVNTNEKIFAISSHRLMLNTQHLNDVFGMLSSHLGKIGYIFVGSHKYDVNKFQDNNEFNKSLLEKKLSYEEIVSSTVSKKEVNELVETHINSGRKVVILTTYHSLDKLKDLDISTIYCDEAHTLASSEEGAEFKDNFEKIKSKRCFFLTATPKDCVEDTESFLMNNKNVFGERIGLTFKECVQKGYIVKPVVHIASPSNLDYEREFKSVTNLSKFVIETFLAHSKFLEEHSFDKDKIAPKLLVKCPSVDEMWKIHKELIGKIDARICAGASRNDESNFCHFIDEQGIVSRSEYLEKMQSFGDGEKAIVLHVDTLAEGININGFTGVEFLGGKLPTIIKVLQNTGRSTRLHREDREKWISGEITVGDGKWIKPYCAVIIPYWDKESEFTTRELAKQIRSLRDNFEYDPTYFLSIGSDISDGKSEDEIDALNKKNDKKKKFELIKEINHEIELMDKEESDLLEEERINGLSMEDWFEEATKDLE